MPALPLRGIPRNDSSPIAKIWRNIMEQGELANVLYQNKRTLSK